jgi:Cof subfamily protein (haloacid dehalogenase superfamily)
MKRKLIFFDIDGTILDHDKRLPVSTKEAIQTLKDIGHEVAIATGRAPYLFEELRDELEINTFVCFNGQYAVIDGKEIYKHPIPNDSLAFFTEMAVKNNHPIIYMDLDQMKTNVENHVQIKECVATLGAEHPEYDPSFFRGKEIFQSLLFCKEIHEFQYLENISDLQFIRWHKYSMDVLPYGGSKARGIEQIVNKLGFEKENVYAFGDNLNDIEMLQFVGNGIAMGNAPETVKKAAKYVTKDVDDNGIVYGLELVGLLK